MSPWDMHAVVLKKADDAMMRLSRYLLTAMWKSQGVPQMVKKMDQYSQGFVETATSTLMKYLTHSCQSL